ncbi:hypothetical protein SAMN05216420_10216 [Nitrosospira sp. Nl5]|nr:hypothetical protein SAMN05216420_10216 [Nitrosospira sp. Nl5]
MGFERIDLYKIRFAKGSVSTSAHIFIVIAKTRLAFHPDKHLLVITGEINAPPLKVDPSRWQLRLDEPATDAFGYGIVRREDVLMSC